MKTSKTRKYLDKRDELILSIFAGFIPFITLAAMVY